MSRPAQIAFFSRLGGGWLFRTRRAYECAERDDFAGFVRRDAPRDVGAYRVWQCRVPQS